MHAPDTNPSQGFKATEQQLADDWVDQETYWRDRLAVPAIHERLPRLRFLPPCVSLRL